MRPVYVLSVGFLGWIAVALAQPSRGDIAVDLSAYKPESGVALRQDDSRLPPMTCAQGVAGASAARVRTRQWQ